MESAWGVVHKAAWKNFYPVPPGVKKIPRSKLVLSSKEHYGMTSHSAQTQRGKYIGGVDTHKGKIAFAGTEPGFRRRGVAGNILDHAEKTTGPIKHSSSRTYNGDAWAKAMDKKRGTRPVPVRSDAKVGRGGTPEYETIKLGNRMSSLSARQGRTGIPKGKKLSWYRDRGT